MADVLTMLNHLLAGWLADNGGGDGWQFTGLRLDAQGGVIRANLARGGFEGEIVMRIDAEPPNDGRQTLHLRIEQWPDKLPGALQPFRRVLEKARLRLELDFNP